MEVEGERRVGACQNAAAGICLPTGVASVAVGVAVIAAWMGDVVVDIAVRWLGLAGVAVVSVRNTWGIVLAIWIVVVSLVPVVVANGLPRSALVTRERGDVWTR